MPTAIKSREELIRQLSIACELEHGLCLQYLFTAFTLKSSLNEGGMTMEEFTYVRKWKANLLFIAAQEMLHLSQAGNLCASIGCGINLLRPNFPQRPSYYPTNLPWGLWPFSQETIILYALYERPVQWKTAPPSWLPDDPFRENTFQQLLADAPIPKDPFGHLPDYFERPKANSYKTIGELYDAIALGFKDIPGELIVGPWEAQVSSSLVDLPQLIQISNRESALQAIELIISQGEGAPSDRIDSHFGFFVQMYSEYAQLKSQRPEFEPVRDVQSNPLSKLHVDNSFPGWRLIHDPYTRKVNNLNNNVYELMLLMLRHTFNGISDPIAFRQALASASLRLMTGVIVPLGQTLTQLPMGNDGSPGAATRAKYAGPGFEIERTLPDLPFSSAAWQYFEEQLGFLGEASHNLSLVPDAPEVITSVTLTLRQIRNQLIQIER
ncbi:ferritin-like domain-containing protein [Moorena sp. SIO4G3]|uniref:ferritin-like domain-containing protein n=1 Tax=Moorena sp. SIO4G3 TaxID=2607821 RepID=UPI00142BFE29|nr:ferritin-like domain-containing protein [Moorena sp. SIO4G3]NEO77617.1 hypothetical protein [Moorena sp. SIO4G3]